MNSQSKFHSGSKRWNLPWEEEECRIKFGKGGPDDERPRQEKQAFDAGGSDRDSRVSMQGDDIQGNRQTNCQGSHDGIEGSQTSCQSS